MNDTSFLTLLYRYFFFSWLFRELPKTEGTLFERAAVMRHNRRQAAWLPVYMVRWLFCASALFLFGQFLELDTTGSLAARVAYLAAAACLSFTCSIGIAWMGLRREVAQ